MTIALWLIVLVIAVFYLRYGLRFARSTDDLTPLGFYLYTVFWLPIMAYVIVFFLLWRQDDP